MTADNIIPLFGPKALSTKPETVARRNRRRAQKERDEEVEITLALIDEHLARVEHCLATVEQSLARIRALSGELKALTGSRCFAAQLKEAEGKRHRGEFGALYDPAHHH